MPVTVRSPFGGRRLNIIRLHGVLLGAHRGPQGGVSSTIETLTGCCGTLSPARILVMYLKACRHHGRGMVDTSRPEPPIGHAMVRRSGAGTDVTVAVRKPGEHRPV